MAESNSSSAPRVVLTKHVRYNKKHNRRGKDDGKGRKKPKRISHKIKYTNPEKLVKRSQKKKKATAMFRKDILRARQGKLAPGQKLFLVFRIRGDEDAPKEALAMLSKLRLHELNTAVLVRASPEMLTALRVLSFYVVFGAPTEATVRDLVLRRGRAAFYSSDSAPHRKDERVLRDNRLIEERLGQFDILCVEDLVLELSGRGEHFFEAARFLAPFRLKAPRDKYLDVARRMVQGSMGDLGDGINEFVSRLL
eukprot:gnl/Chilomastix_cuspidata/463.p1 GENE.gnl/Chilomastix_cuspidata/463~~gnl/Chilomastix_cuspidata/463.p1  ORF type:complete len:252 (+),score=135.62 gnl/Chilomastix_cuspidata/463:524-1279(+)